MAGARRGHCAGDATPRRDCGVRSDAAFEDLVPADQPSPARAEERFDPLHEVALQLRFVLHAELAHPRLNPRR